MNIITNAPPNSSIQLGTPDTISPVSTSWKLAPNAVFDDACPAVVVPVCPTVVPVDPVAPVTLVSVGVGGLVEPLVVPLVVGAGAASTVKFQIPAIALPTFQVSCHTAMSLTPNVPLMVQLPLASVFPYGVVLEPTVLVTCVLGGAPCIVICHVSPTYRVLPPRLVAKLITIL